MSDPYAPTLGHPNMPVASQSKVTKVLASTNPEQVSVTRRFFKRARVGGFKGNNTANAGTVYIGADSSNPHLAVASGAFIELSLADWPNDLSKYWLRGASADGVVIIIEESVE